MAIELIQPRDKFLMKPGTIEHRAVIGHVRSVLMNFAVKGLYSRFYIGITGSLEDRLAQHQKTRPDFRLMVPVYEEPAQYHAEAFDHLELDAINAFRGGIVHPETKVTVLTCANGAGGAVAKRWLYVLFG